jgi:hypothetical protein
MIAIHPKSTRMDYLLRRTAQFSRRGRLRGPNVLENRRGGPRRLQRLVRLDVLRRPLCYFVLFLWGGKDLNHITDAQFETTDPQVTLEPFAHPTRIFSGANCLEEIKLSVFIRGRVNPDTIPYHAD